MTIIEDTQAQAPEKPTKKEKVAKQEVAVHRMPAAPNPVSIVERAIEKGITGADLKEIMDLQERYEANQARKAFDRAMSDAKAKIPTIKRNRDVDSGGRGPKYRFEDLAEIAKTVDPILSECGLSYRFRVSSEIDKPVTVTCVISHRDGHFEETTLTAGPDNGPGRNAIQQVGSTLTYLQRYSLKAALGLAVAHDDDGIGSEGGNATIITALQLKELEALAKEVGADVPAACKHLHIGSLAELPTVKFDRVKQLLEAKRTPL